MNCLYQTTTVYSYEEYKRFSRSILLKRSSIVWFAVLELWLLLCGWLLDSVFLLVFAVVYPILIWLLQSRQIKRIYRSNKVVQDMLVTFSFYETFFTETNENGESRLEYTKLHRIIETKTNFYLMISKNQGYILTKADLSDGLAHFLRQIKL